MIFRTLIAALFVFVHLHAANYKEYLTREDSSLSAVYYSAPDGKDSFPLVLYVDGSLKQSIQNNFSFLSLLFSTKNIGVVAVEKRGLDNEEEWLLHDCYEERLSDHVLLIQNLKKMVPGWNGQLILIGSSEGGKIVPRLTLEFPEFTYGTILIGSGGGMSFGDEIRYQINQIMLEDGEDPIDDEIDQEYAKILNAPSSLTDFFGKTYKWFSYYLRYDLMADLLKIETPLLMVHGVKDTHIPVESADLIQSYFDFAQKNNLEYYRYDDLGHSISKRIDIFFAILEWSDQKLVQEMLQAVE